MTAIADELVALQVDDLLQAEKVVKWAAQHPDSALHGALDWDDTTAAHKYRIAQVRRLIAFHIVNVKGERQMVSLTIDRVQPMGGYRPIETVLAAPDLRRVLLADALAELQRVRAKYEGLVELAKVWEALDEARSEAKPSSVQSSEAGGALQSGAESSKAQQA